VIYDSTHTEVKRKTLTKTTSTTDYPLWQTLLSNGDYTVIATCTTTATCTNSAPFTIAGNTVTVDLPLPCLSGKMAAKRRTARPAKAPKAKACTCTCACGARQRAKPAAKRTVKKAPGLPGCLTAH
jgi:hypothetical protein